MTPNPALDITYRLADWRLHAVNRVATVEERPGGKGVNVARLLAAHDVPATVHGFCGGTSGHRLTTLLHEFAPGLEQRWTEADVETRRTIAVVDAHDTTMFNEPGDPVTDRDWAGLIDQLAQSCAPGDVVTVSGSLPQGSSPDRLSELVQAVRGKGALIVVDTSGPALLAASAAGAHVLKPNHHELAEVTETNSIGQGITALLNHGAVAVLVSRGADGLVLGTAEASHSARLDRPLTGNPTGAGDAVVAAVAAGLVSDDRAPVADRLLAALPSAVAWSAAAVLAPVAGEMDLDRAAELIRSVTVKER
ncbi:1-phosphofructokinase family hexose kinase [Enemella sp. A6]|uniref:1-phosphofructokinase family hexose kinase n=1 Tax=Enemella sp. A6 TaxID=3440152 RepID=UPI003EBD07D8